MRNGRIEGAFATEGAQPRSEQGVGGPTLGALDSGGSRDPAIRISGLSKTFGGVRALDHVSLTIEAGGVHALVGGNGSGKSTLIKVLAGVHMADPGGSITLGVDSFGSHDLTSAVAHRSGLRFVHQALGLFPDLTVAENLALPSGFPLNGAGRIKWRTLRRDAVALLDRFGIPAEPGWKLSDLRPAHQTMVAVARALSDEHEIGRGAVLVLDEPTALLPYEEATILLDAVRAYAKQGRTIVYISHRLDEVIDIADTVTVFRDGHHVITRPMEGLDERALVEYIVGRELGALYPDSGDPAPGDAVCELREVRGGPVADVDLVVREGEIVGLAGVVGSGCTELLEMLFGLLDLDDGEILLGGKSVRMRSPADAIGAGIAYIPADRARDAAFLDQPVRENLFTGVAKRGSRWGHVSKRSENRSARQLMERFLVRAQSENSLLSSLSGGNQQKVIVSRWLARKPRLLLMNEPTQGVDVGSRAELYALIRDAANGGMAVVVSSADADELAHLCDRVVLVADGRIAGELAPPELSVHRLTEAVLLGRATTNGGLQ